MDDEEFLTQLKELCLRYDASEGDWPESKHEGCSLWRFANNNYNYDFKIKYQYELNGSK